MFRFWIPIAVVLAALAVAATAQADRGVRPAESAGSYMKTIVKQKLASQYDLVWQSLYPAHQRVASRDAYVACESLIPSMGELASVKVLHVFNERIAVAGVAHKVKTRAVRVWVAVAVPSFPQFPVITIRTFHAIAVAGQWRWILSPDQYSYYSEGTCPWA